MIEKFIWRFFKISYKLNFSLWHLNIEEEEKTYDNLRIKENRSNDSECVNLFY
jgi:hypothetical protein